LNIIKEFPVLELEGFIFKHGTDNLFNIAHLEDDTEFPDFIDSGRATSYFVEHHPKMRVRILPIFLRY
jgi:hypothetical protein